MMSDFSVSQSTGEAPLFKAHMVYPSKYVLLLFTHLMRCLNIFIRLQVSLNMVATPPQNVVYRSLEPHDDEKKKKKKKMEAPIVKKSRQEKFEALSQRLRLRILKRVGHRRTNSS